MLNSCIDEKGNQFNFDSFVTTFINIKGLKATCARMSFFKVDVSKILM